MALRSVFVTDLEGACLWVFMMSGSDVDLYSLM